MGLLYDRVLEVKVYAGGRAYTYSDLHIEFEAMGSLDENPNNATISIYNLNKDSRRLFAEDSNAAIEIYAGHDDESVLIYRGEIDNVISVKMRQGFKSTFYCGDGNKEFSEKFFSKTFSKGTPVSKILTEVAKSFGLPINIDLTAIPKTILLNSVTYDGMCKDVLSTICATFDLTWSIQYGVIEVLQADEFLATDPTAIIIRSDTGMIGAPIITKREGKKGENKPNGSGKFTKNVTIYGIQIMSILNGEIKPGRLINVMAMETVNQFGKLMEVKTPHVDANGVYLVEKVRYFGNNFGGEFNIEINASVYL